MNDLFGNVTQQQISSLERDIARRELHRLIAVAEDQATDDAAWSAISKFEVDFDGGRAALGLRQRLMNRIVYRDDGFRERLHGVPR